MSETGKPFYKSKTFWFNLLLLAIAIAKMFGFEGYEPSASDAETLALILAVGNLLLRFLTKEPLKL